jgi:putative membrane protein insertion efficiency factor
MRGRPAVIVTVFLCVIVLGWDLTRPPKVQVTTRLALTTIDLYQATASKALRRAGARCRFKPTCSNYGEYAIRQHGVAKGGWLTAKRIFRCGPWTPMGTWDSPPGTELEKLPVPTSPDLVPPDSEPPAAESPSGEL